MEEKKDINMNAAADTENQTMVPGSEKTVKKQEAISGIFEGPIASTTLKLSIPIIISQFLAFAYIIVDTVFISMINRQSTAMISGTGLVYPIYSCVINLATGLLLGISSLIARGIGEKNDKVINNAADSGLFLAIIIGAFTLISGLIFGGDMVHFIAGSQLTAETIQYGIDYFNFLLPGMVLLFLTHAFVGILQGEGSMKYLGISIFLSTAFNIILNPVLIFVFGLGVRGSALATTLAIGLTEFYFLYLFLRKKTVIPIRWRVFQASIKQVKEILRIGIPASLGLFSISISSIVLNNIVSSISQEAMNSWVLVTRLDQILIIPGAAIAATTITMIGQNFGRGNLERAQKIFKVNLMLCAAICAGVALLYFITSPGIYSLFSSRPEVVEGCIRQVRLLAFTTIWVAVSMVVSSTFQATGRPIPDLVLVIIRMGIISIPLSLLLIHYAKMEMYGVFIGVGTGNVISFIIALLWGRSYIKKLHIKGKGIGIGA
ncbi:MAG: MATE family efflux transporter [Clostridia bacterium]|nr:MATE family efflux transporter [Clostridia bacterium]